MSSAVCTLFEGNYHFGLAALVNSLYLHGFRGVIWAGYRGALPEWANPLNQCEGYKQFDLADKCVIRFIEIDTPLHFTNYKPAFIIELLKIWCSESQGLLYFDPDIVIKCRWQFYEEWIDGGIALCQEITNGNMPSDHPLRLAWKQFAASYKYQCQRQLNQYFNGGFIGLKQSHIQFVNVWKELIDVLPSINIDTRKFFAEADRSHMILSPDQDTLNIAAMVTCCPLSTIGPEGMDFVPGGFTMSHAVGSPKPWDKNMIVQALKGSGPTTADKQYFLNVEGPIRIYDKHVLFRKRLSLQVASLIGRFIKRR